MATIRKEQAIDRLTRAVRSAGPDDLVEFHNELFPQVPTTENEVAGNLSSVVEEIIAHIARGLEVEEVVALWNVIFPAHQRVWFDEDDNVLHYDEKTEHVSQAD